MEVFSQSDKELAAHQLTPFCSLLSFIASTLQTHQQKGHFPEPKYLPFITSPQAKNSTC